MPVRWIASPLTALLSFALPLAAYALLTREPIHGPTDLGHGVTYAAEDLSPDVAGAGSGRIYWGSAKLDPAALDLFVTPPDPSLAGSQWTHRLARTADVSDRNRLAIATNGSLFLCEGLIPKLRREGSRAYTGETTVVEGKVVHWWEHAYMLGFTADLTPVPLRDKPPPPPDVLQTWRWGIGTQGWALFDLKPFDRDDAQVGRWTAVGLDLPNKILFLAVVEHASRLRLTNELQKRGATHVLFVDGSESSTFAVNGRAITGDWRPVANHLGVKFK